MIMKTDYFCLMCKALYSIQNKIFKLQVLSYDDKIQHVIDQLGIIKVDKYKWVGWM